MIGWVAVGCVVGLAQTGYGATRSARVRWRPSASTGVAGYRVYVRPSGAGAETRVDVGRPATATDGTITATVGSLDAATVYRFTMTSYRATGPESARSNEVTLPVTATTSTSTVRPATTTTTTVSSAGTCPIPLRLPATGGVTQGLTAGPSRYAASCAGTGNAPEAVVRWRPTVSGPVAIETCGAGTAFDTVLEVRKDSCTGTRVGCNDDAPACVTAGGVLRGSRLTFDAVKDQIYFIVVDGYSAQRGAFTLTIRPASGSGAAGRGEAAPPETGQTDDDACAVASVSLSVRRTIRDQRLRIRADLVTTRPVDPTAEGIGLLLERPEGDVLLGSKAPPDSIAVNPARTAFRVRRPAGLQHLRVTRRDDRLRLYARARTPLHEGPTDRLRLSLDLGGGCLVSRTVDCVEQGRTSRCE